jgi:hypothetical protein
MVSKAVWGPAVWYLFHTLAQKVDESQFMIIRNELIQFVYRICANLPCPECASHAEAFLKKNSNRPIRNKEDFKRLLLDLHNHANANTKKPMFTYEQLNEKYDRANTQMVVQNFFNIYGAKTYNIKLLTNRFHKDILLSDFSAWILRNSTKFQV